MILRSVDVTGALRETDTEHKLSTFSPHSRVPLPKLCSGRKPAFAFSKHGKCIILMAQAEAVDSLKAGWKRIRSKNVGASRVNNKWSYKRASRQTKEDGA